jgi:hypothetical protein
MFISYNDICSKLSHGVYCNILPIKKKKNVVSWCMFGV